MDKKTFALEQLRPYAKDPSICGVKQIDGHSSCVYLTDDGRMCVAGKNLLNPKKYKGSIGYIINIYGEDILKPEARGILTSNEWEYLQSIHDSIAFDDKVVLIRDITALNLFTYEELFN